MQFSMSLATRKIIYVAASIQLAASVVMFYSGSIFEGFDGLTHPVTWGFLLGGNSTLMVSAFIPTHCDS